MADQLLLAELERRLASCGQIAAWLRPLRESGLALGGNSDVLRWLVDEYLPHLAVESEQLGSFDPGFAGRTRTLDHDAAVQQLVRAPVASLAQLSTLYEHGRERFSMFDPASAYVARSAEVAYFLTLDEHAPAAIAAWCRLAGSVDELSLRYELIEALDAIAPLPLVDALIDAWLDRSRQTDDLSSIMTRVKEELAHARRSQSAAAETWWQVPRAAGRLRVVLKLLDPQHQWADVDTCLQQFRTLQEPVVAPAWAALGYPAEASRNLQGSVIRYAWFLPQALEMQGRFAEAMELQAEITSALAPENQAATPPQLVAMLRRALLFRMHGMHSKFHEQWRALAPAGQFDELEPALLSASHWIENLTFSYDAALAAHLLMSEGSRATLRWLERRLGITSFAAATDHEIGAAVQSQLPRLLATLPIIAGGLSQLLAPQQSLRLLELALGTWGVSDNDLAEQLRRAPVQALRGLVPYVAQWLVASGNPRRAACYLFPEASATPAERIDHFAALLSAWGIDREQETLAWITFCDVAFSIFRALSWHAAEELWLAYVTADLAWTAARGNATQSLLAANLIERCLTLPSAYRAPYASELCTQVGLLLRHAVASAGAAAADRVVTLQSTMRARHVASRSLVTLSLRAENFDAARKLRCESLVIDAELSQRVLREQIRLRRAERHARELQPPQATTSSIAAASPPGWSMPRANDQTAEWSQALPFALDLRASPAWESFDPGTTDQLAPRGLSDGLSATDDAPEMAYSSQRLAATLAPHEALLTLGFALTGEFVWNLFRRQQDDLALVACDAGSGSATDEQRVQSAIDRLEMAMRLAWPIDAAASWKSQVESEVAAISFGLRKSLDRATLERQYRLLLDRLAEFRPLVAAARSAFDAAFSGSAAISSVDWNAWWQNALAELPDTATVESELHERLASALDNLLAELSTILPIATIATHLRPDDHLLLQVEGVLHAIPLAMLHAGGAAVSREKFLCEQVSTLQVIPSLLALADLRQAETAANFDSSRPQLLSLSSLDRDDPRETPVAQLFECQQAALRAELLGQTPIAIDWTIAGNDPPGSYRTLQTMLAERRAIPLATLVGHGSSSPGGMLLQASLPEARERYELWTGSELWTATSERTATRAMTEDLAAVQLLLQVSCSIGRIRQSGLQDFDGFCIRLFESGLRSTIAARWRIHGSQAVLLATEIARDYLTRRMRESDAPTNHRRDRAESLAAVRLRWIHELRSSDAATAARARERSATLAAFELFGLG